MNANLKVSLSGAALLMMSGVGYCGTEAEADRSELESRLAAAEARLAELETSQGQQWLTEQRAAEIRALVQDVLADADTRASLLQGGMNAGYNNGFFISSADGNFALQINGYLQARFVWNNQDDSPSDDDRWGFENTRTKLIFSGHAVSPQWTYLVEGNFSRSGGSFALDDAWINYDYDNGWSVKVGQFKAPLLREELIDSRYQQAVERTNVNEIYTGDRVQGIMVTYTGDQFRFMGSYNDGVVSANTPWSMEDTEFSLTGRVEALFGEGDWSRYDDLQSWRSDSGTGAVIGGAVHWQKAEFGTGTGAGLPFSFNDDELELLVLTADAQIEFGGANLFGAVIYRNLDTDAADADQIAFIVQGGYFFTDEWEGFARYEWSDLDLTGVDDLSLVTVGVTKYFGGNNAKWTTDVGYGFEEVAVASDLTGWRAGGDDGQFVVRTQWQLAF